MLAVVVVSVQDLLFTLFTSLNVRVWEGLIFVNWLLATFVLIMVGCIVASETFVFTIVVFSDAPKQILLPILRVKGCVRVVFKMLPPTNAEGFEKCEGLRDFPMGIKTFDDADVNDD